MKEVLIYGDSLVYGKMPGSPKRYPREKNFIGVLERELGKEFKIIDEGLRARTLGGENGFFPERNGLSQFGAILGSHLPADLVCIFLGTNDCNKADFKEFEEIPEILSEYKNKIDWWLNSLSIEQKPKILVIAPPIIRGSEVVKCEGMRKIFDETSENKSKILAEIYESFCIKNDCQFFDASKHCTGADGEGVHLDENSNETLGLALSIKIQQIFHD